MLISLESIIIAKFIIFIKHYQVTTAKLDHDVAMLRSEPLQTQVWKRTQANNQVKTFKDERKWKQFCSVHTRFRNSNVFFFWGVTGSGNCSYGKRCYVVKTGMKHWWNYKENEEQKFWKKTLFKLHSFVPQASYILPQDQTGTSAAKDRRLSSWYMTRHLKKKINRN